MNGRLVVTRAVSPEAYEHVTRALLYEEEERWQEAADELQRALPFDPDAAEVRAELAELFVRLGRLDDAADEVARSLPIAPTVDGLPGRGAPRRGAARRRRTAGASRSRRCARRPAWRSEAKTRRRSSGPTSSSPTRRWSRSTCRGAPETLRRLVQAAPETLRGRVQLAALAWPLGALRRGDAGR